MQLPIAGAEIVGGEHAGKAVAAFQPAQIGRCGMDVVAGVEGVRPQTVRGRHFLIGAGHQLHQALRARMADDGDIARHHGAAAGFVAHHRAQPHGGNVVFFGRLAHHRVPAVEQAARAHLAFNIVGGGAVGYRVLDDMRQAHRNRRRFRALMLQPEHARLGEQRRKQQGAGIFEKQPRSGNDGRGQTDVSGAKWFVHPACARSRSVQTSSPAAIGTSARMACRLTVPMAIARPYDADFVRRPLVTKSLIPRQHGTVRNRMEPKFRQQIRVRNYSTANEVGAAFARLFSTMTR